MSDLMRMTGLYSGMDTEAVIQSLVSAKSKKVTDLKNEQKKLEWKQNVWQDLNSKIYNLYSKTLSNLRLSGGYTKKTTTVSDPTKASIVAGNGAFEGEQSLQITQLAKAKNITGATITSANGLRLKSSNTLGAIDSGLVGSTIKVKTGTGDNAKTTNIEIKSDMTINDFVNELNKAGVKASFDEDNQKFFITAPGTGNENSFDFEVDGYTGSNANGALAALGIGNNADIVNAQDAEIKLNGATFTSSTNTFKVNGLTITATGVTGDDELSITTKTDYDAIYNTIKDFLSEYNDIVNEVYSKYNADSARKFPMLTDEEKESMSEDEVEKWEDTIKGSLLRKDNDLYKVLNGLTSGISKGFQVNGQTMFLSNFGIGTLNYFEADESERKSLHIDGDEDDENTSAKDDKLMAALTSDTKGTIAFFAAFCRDMYENLNDTMQKTEYRSIYKVYDDKRLQNEYDSYTKKIAEAEKKLSAYEDRWYAKFSAMEVALAKLQSNQSTISSMLGMY